MKKLGAIMGYLAALSAIVIVLATFIGLNEWSNGLVSVTGLKVSPWFSGGDIDRTISRNNYRIVLHKPVFMGLIAETKTGFVQADWTPFPGLPATIHDEVDFDSDGKNDYRVRLDTTTGKASIYPENQRILGLQEVLKLQNGWMVRVKLRNKDE